MSFKSRLAYYLRSSNLTAAELARRSGVSKQTISDWLSGAQPRSVYQLKKVAGVFGVTLDDLLFESKPNEHDIKGLHRGFGRPSPDRRIRNDRSIAFSICLNGFLRHCTPSMSWHLGWSIADLSGRPFTEFIHFDDLQRTRLKMIEQPRLGSTVQAIDTRFLAKDGHAKWLRWSATALTLHEEGLTYVTCEDVSSEYPNGTERAQLRSVLHLAGEAVTNCKQNSSFQGIKYDLHCTSSSLAVECFPARLSAVILGLLHQASLGLVNVNKASIRLNLHEDTRNVLIQTSSEAARDFQPNIDVPLQLLASQSESLSYSSSDGRLHFSLVIPKAVRQFSPA
jgi:PAS domain S-box-containing protein